MKSLKEHWKKAVQAEMEEQMRKLRKFMENCPANMEAKQLLTQMLMSKRQAHILTKNRKKTYGNAYFLKKDVPLHPKGNQATDVASM